MTVIARLENHPQWDGIRGYGLQRVLSVESHKKSKCSIEDIKKFQDVLPNYQIHVVSKDHINGIIYDGIEGGIPIYLYYQDEHFDVITKMTGFLNRSYFCQQCKKGYDHKEKHPCVYCHPLHADEEENRRFCDECSGTSKMTPVSKCI